MKKRLFKVGNCYSVNSYVLQVEKVVRAWEIGAEEVIVEVDVLKEKLLEAAAKPNSFKKEFNKIVFFKDTIQNENKISIGSNIDVLDVISEGVIFRVNLQNIENEVETQKQIEKFAKEFYKIIELD